MRKADYFVKRKGLHITVPPRLKGKVKNAKMNPIRKKKKSARGR
jgi:hypothetical protein